MTSPEPGTTPPGGDAIGPGRKRPADPPRSIRKGDVPPALLDRYLIERDLRGRPERFYRDHRAPQPAFRDLGRKLETGGAYPDTIADMLKVAEHRGWSRIRVEGADSFRRDVWIQARARGLEVEGYRPRDRDRQAAGEPPKAPPLDAELRRRLDQASVIVRHIVADPRVAQRLIAEAIERARERADRDTPRRDRSRTR
ncbi:MAG: hypothetical protein ACI8Y6_000537 [Brevundimonas sp.]|jgi:hypothetical protein